MIPAGACVQLLGSRLVSPSLSADRILSTQLQASEKQCERATRQLFWMALCFQACKVWEMRSLIPDLSPSVLVSLRGGLCIHPGALVFIVTARARVSQVYFVPFQAVTSITQKFGGCAVCLGLRKPVQFSACACFEQLGVVQTPHTGVLCLLSLCLRLPTGGGDTAVFWSSPCFSVGTC